MSLRTKVGYIIFGVFTLLIIFQNCADEINMGEYNLSQNSKDESFSLAQDLTSVRVLPGQSLRLAARFKGAVSKYIWYKDGVAQLGANESELVIDPVTTSSFGQYMVEAWSLDQSTSIRSSEVEVKLLDRGAVLSIIAPIVLED